MLVVEGPILDLKKGTARVLVRMQVRKRRSYRVCLGHETYALFYDDTLPDIFKQKMAMISAMGDEVIDRWKSVDLRSMFDLVPPNKELQDIGWRHTKREYVVVIPITELERIRGTAINIRGIALDPRIKSEEES